MGAAVLSGTITPSAGRATARPALMEIRGLSKWFPGVRALTDVDFTLRPGEVHGLVGQNGAGKSTLMKIISGVHRPDAGSVTVDGAELRYGAPRAPRDAGIAVIYQELTIVPEMSAMDNVFLNGSERAVSIRSRSRSHARFRELAKRLGIHIDPSVRAGSLSVAEQQLLEIMRALDGRHRMLLMDEPTAALGHSERQALYRIIETLRADGLGIVYISHDLDEVLAVSDRVSVMRDGRRIVTQEAAAATKEDLVRVMVGHAVAVQTRGAGFTAGAEVLRVESLSVPGRVDDVSFAVRQGEILGLAGLVGSGRTEILRAIAGADTSSAGRLFLDGRAVAWPRSVAAALRLGIALAPEDRKTQGLVVTRTGAENVVMSDMRQVTRRGLINGRRREQLAAEACRPLQFDTARLGDLVATLSGGNQQKLALAKWIHRGPRVLLMDEPTRGIDIGAKAEILTVMRRLADQGLAIVFVSSELEELVDAVDRTVVIAGGRAVTELTGAELSVHRILSVAFDAEEES